MTIDEPSWESESEHAHLEDVLASMYEALAYIRVGRLTRNDRRESARLKLSDIYVPLRSDVHLDVEVRGSRPAAIVLRQGGLQLGRAVSTDDGPVFTPLSPNVDPSFLDLLLEQCTELIATGACQGLRVAPRPLIAAPLWADGARAGVATLEAASAVNVYRRTVLLGPPGSGKSTLAKVLALAHLRPHTRVRGGAGPESLGLWRRNPLFPIYVELRQMVADADFPLVNEPATVEDLLSYIKRITCRNDDRLYRYISAQLYEGQAYLILDGLDEVSVPHNIPDAFEHRRNQITSLIESTTGRFSAAKMLVTSRPAGYSGWSLMGFDVLHLVPLSDNEARALIFALYRGMGHPPKWCRERSDLLDEQLPSIPESLRTQPLFVALLALLFETQTTKLPRQRGALLSEAIQLLLGAWSVPRTGEQSLTSLLGCTSEQLLLRLEVVALKALELGESARLEESSIPRSLILDELYELGSHVNPSDALEFVSQYAGILFSPAPRRYRFAIRLFQEYLAASALAKSTSPGSEILELLKVSSVTWREVALLLGDVLTNQRRTGELWELIDDLGASPLPRLRLLAADVVIDQRVENRPSRVYEPIMNSLRISFKRALTDVDLSPAERQRVGAALALVGDDRPGVGVSADGTPDIRWCFVPSGRATIGSDHSSREPLRAFGDGWNFEREEPCHSVAVGRFDLGCYEITVDQYQAFVEAKVGYLDPRWWSADGLIWKSTNAPAHRPVELPGNSPQSGVTWYEANAFCKWVSARLESLIRLPTEIEWEWAARGPAGTLYPWGNDPDSTKANTLEAKVMTPMTVGSFDSLTPWSPAGPSDLVGNVWEWCSTAVETTNGLFKYPYVFEDGRENPEGGDLVKRATRGGYFGTTQAVSRSSLRGRDIPSVRVSRQGFRVLRERKIEQMNISHTRVEVNEGLSLHVQTSGPIYAADKPVIVFAHGFITAGMENHGIFIRAARQAHDRGYSTVLFDFQGAGYSDGDYEDFRVTSSIDHLKRIAAWSTTNTSCNGRVVFFGQSLGSALSVVAGSEMSSEVDAMVLWNLSGNFEARYSEIFGLDSAASRVQCIPAKGFVVGGEFLRDAGTVHVLDRVSECPMPIFLLSCTGDLVGDVSIAQAAALGAANPLSIHQSLPATHSFMCERDLEMQATCISLDWLDNCTSGPSRIQ